MKKVPYQNRSPHGWWIATYLECVVWSDEPKLRPDARAYAWENTILVSAQNRNIAYKKAVAFGKTNRSKFKDKRGRAGRWQFLGLTSLLPVYDKLEDGSEILWVEHKNRPFKSLLKKIRRKSDLEAFDDSPSKVD